MSVIVEHLPELSVTGVSRWCFNYYPVAGDDGLVVVDAGLPSVPDDIEPLLRHMSGAVCTGLVPGRAVFVPRGWGVEGDRRARGQSIGRPKALDQSKVALAQRMPASGESANIIASTLGVSRATVYRVLAEDARADCSSPEG